MSMDGEKKLPLAAAAKQKRDSLTTEEMLEALKKEQAERLAAIVHRYLSDED